MTLNVPTYVGLESGKTLLDGLNVQNAINENRLRTNQSLTALGTTQITGFQCQGDLSNFTTVAANTVCCLPPANPGRQHIILNNGANTLKIYPYGGVGAASVDTTSTIDGGAAGANTTLTTVNRIAIFYCVASGVWISALLGAVSS